MTEKEVLTATDEWISWLKRLYTCTSDENKKQTQKHIELLERLREMAVGRLLDKERLKEIEAKHSILTVTSERNDIEYIEVDVKDLVFLIQNGFKQAERVEELEKEKITNQELREQNKRLREAIIEAIADIEEISPHEAKKTLREALKNIYELA